MAYIPNLAIGPTRVNEDLVRHILSERRRLGMDEGFAPVPRPVRDPRGRFLPRAPGKPGQFAGYCKGAR